MAAFLIDLVSMAPVARLHRVIRHRTALLWMDETLPPGATPPICRLNNVALYGVYSSFERMLSPTGSFVNSLVDFEYV